MAAAMGAPANGAVNDDAHFNVMGLVIVWAADAASGAPVASDFIVDTGTGGTAATSGDVDLIASDVHTVVTGSLIATQDSMGTGGIPFIIENTTAGTLNTDTTGDGLITDDDAFSPFGLQVGSDARVDATRTYTSFYVASNTPFAIDAQAVPPTTFTQFILLLRTNMLMSVTRTGDDGIAFGSAAQFPHSAGASGGFAGSQTLFSLLGAQRIFTGNQRTAVARGTIADHSVRFDVEYSIGAGTLSGYDLSFGTFDFEVDMIYTVYAP